MEHDARHSATELRQPPVDSTSHPELVNFTPDEMSWRQNLKISVMRRNVLLRLFMAEFLGTFLLLTFGNGAVAQSVLSNNGFGDFFSINWGYGIGVMFGVFASINVSGGHLNPAVTLAMAMLGRVAWRKVPMYICGQFLGTFISSAVVFGVYHDAINNFDGGNRSVVGPTGTAGIFATYPKDFVSSWTGLGDQIVGTALLLICVCAIVDKKNANPHTGLAPFLIGLIVCGIGIAFGFNCGYAINPARDLGPRIFTAIAGWGSEVFSFRNYNWFWVPVVGPIVGGLLGALSYQGLVGAHWSEEVNYYVNQAHEDALNVKMKVSSGDYRNESVQRNSPI